jgi:hypothetical protein
MSPAFFFKVNFHHYTSEENSSATHTKDFFCGKNEPKSHVHYGQNISTESVNPFYEFFYKYQVD